MIEMLKEYKKERENKDTYITDKGFAIYQINKDECYIEDIYIRPEYRNQKEASSIGVAVEKIAKEQGCKYVSGTVFIGKGNQTESTLRLLTFGFRVAGADKNIIYFIKDI